MTRVGASNSISNTDTVDTDLVDGGVDGKKIDEVGAERVLAGEANLNVVGLDVVDDLDGSVCNVSHILAVGVLHEVGRSADNDIDSINTGLDGNSGIVHVAANVGENFGLQAELADGLAISS